MIYDQRIRPAGVGRPSRVSLGQWKRLAGQWIRLDPSEARAGVDVGLVAWVEVRGPVQHPARVRLTVWGVLLAPLAPPHHVRGAAREHVLVTLHADDSRTHQQALGVMRPKLIQV